MDRFDHWIYQGDLDIDDLEVDDLPDDECDAEEIEP